MSRRSNVVERTQPDAMGERVRSIVKDKGGKVWSVGPNISVYDAIALMAEKGVGALLVASDEELLGIISERDYARKVILQGRSSRETAVKEIMTSPVVTVTLEHTVGECMTIITTRRIRHLPVLESGRLVGMVSIGDCVNSIISAQAHTIDQLNSYIQGSYPG